METRGGEFYYRREAKASKKEGGLKGGRITISGSVKNAGKRMIIRKEVVGAIRKFQKEASKKCLSSTEKRGVYQRQGGDLLVIGKKNRSLP